MPAVIQLVNILSGIALVIMGIFCIFFAKENKQKTATVILNVKEKVDTFFSSRDNVHYND